MGRGSSKLSEGNEKPLGGQGGNGDGEEYITVQPYRMNPETMVDALGTKGRVMSINKALDGANPFYNGDGGAQGNFTENCQRSVIAYEARRRGYDVIAQPTYAGDDLPIGGNWTKAFKNANTVSVGSTSPKKAQANLEKEMKSYGNGARAVVHIPGHVFNCENDHGKIRYVDAQTNTVYNSNNVFSRVGRKSVSIKLTRTDNLDFTETAKRAVTPVTETMRRIGRTSNKRK